VVAREDEMALAIKKEHFALTSDQVQGWVKANLDDSKWVVMMKTRSDKAKARMRAKGLLSSK
jgi:hypothetical protein